MSTKFESLSDQLFLFNQIDKDHLFEIKGGNPACNSYHNTYVYQNGDHLVLYDDGSSKGEICEGWI